MKPILIIFFVFEVIFTVAGSAQTCLYKKALESYQQENFTQAIADFDAVLSDPAACPDVQMADVYYWRAWCEYKVGQKQQALADFLQAEASQDNGMVALYMQVWIARSLDPGNTSLLQESIEKLNSLIASEKAPASLKDQALLFRDLLRLQVGEMLYNINQISNSKNYFQGILSRETSIHTKKLQDYDDIVSASALSWLLHLNLSQGIKIDDKSLTAASEAALPSFEEGQVDLQFLSRYYESLLHLFAYLLLNDYEQFYNAKNAVLLLDSQNKILRDYLATIDLLEENYQAVINAPINGEPFGDYRKGWAHFLSRSSNDLKKAAAYFKSSRDALKPCKTSLRKSSAFRYMQVGHFRDWQSEEFVENKLSQYFARECISDPSLIAQQQIWVDMLKEYRGYIDPACSIGRGYLELGLYKGSAKLVDSGKKQIFDLGCDFAKDDLVRAILFCIGNKPDFEKAIGLLKPMIDRANVNKDEVKYALAMAYYNNGQATDAIPLLIDLAEKGSLDACYKLAIIYNDIGKKSKACQYISTIIQHPDVYTIYRNDATILYSRVGCGALGGDAIRLPAESKVSLRYPNYHVFAYDYYGQGVGIISKLFYEMKTELVKIIKPRAKIDLYNLGVLEPAAALTAYINLTISTPLGGIPELSIFLDGKELQEVSLKENGDQYIFSSGPKDMGDYSIAVDQKGSFGWTYSGFISGNFEKEIVLDSAFVLRKRMIWQLPKMMINISRVEQIAGSEIAFSPDFVAKDGELHKLPADVGEVTSVAQVDNAFYCLSSGKSKVQKVILMPPDSTVSELFIRGVYDSKNDIPEYQGGLVKPLKILYNDKDRHFYVLNSNGTIFEFNSSGHCIGAINKPTPESFILDIVYDAGENCFWLLDVAKNVIHKYDLTEGGYKQYESKKITDDILPFSLLIDANYFYLVTVDGELHLHKKGNFRLLNVFSLADKSEQYGFFSFSLAGENINDKKIIALRKQASAEKIWPKDVVEVFESQFDPGFESGK